MHDSKRPDYLPRLNVSDAVLAEMKAKIADLEHATITISEQWNAAADRGDTSVIVSTRHLGFMMQMAYKYMGQEALLLDTGVREGKH